MTTSRFAVAVLAAGLALGACSNRHTYSGDNRAMSEFDRLSGEVTGTFSNAAQADDLGPDGKPVWMNVELHIVQIQPSAEVARAAGHAPSARWFYIEQAEAGVLDKPYRQHLSVVRETSDGGFASQVHTFTGDPYRFAGWWKNPESFTHHVSPGDIELRHGCEVAVRAQGGGRFSGGTVGTGCPNTSKGASYATSEITITPTEIRAWDRGYDAAGRQVWGSTTGPYIFVKK